MRKTYIKKFRCEKCNSGATYFRVSTKERVCRICGFVKNVEEEIKEYVKDKEMPVEEEEEEDEEEDEEPEPDDEEEPEPDDEDKEEPMPVEENPYLLPRLDKPKLQEVSDRRWLN